MDKHVQLNSTPITTNFVQTDLREHVQLEPGFAGFLREPFPRAILPAIKASSPEVRLTQLDVYPRICLPIDKHVHPNSIPITINFIQTDLRGL